MAIGIEGIAAVSQARALAAALRDGVPLAGAADRATAPDGSGALGSALAGAAPSVAGATPPAAPMLGSVQMIVTLAAFTPREVQRRERVAEARRGVAALERLHRALQGGALDRRTLEELAEWIARRDAAGQPPSDEAPGGDADAGADSRADATLKALLEAVDLRVRVELAKLDVRF